MKKQINVRQMTLDAVLVAMYVALNYVSFKTGNFHFTFDAFPIIVAALLFGPADGALVGFMGALIYQLFFSGYPVTPTTPLWILPAVIRGLMLGAWAKHCRFEMKTWQLILAITVSAFTVTLLNTLALYVDSRIYNYYSYAMVFGLLIPKFIVGIILSVVYALVIPGLLRHIKKNVKLPERGNR